jgi:hypothetical protein
MDDAERYRFTTMMSAIIGPSVRAQMVISAVVRILHHEIPQWKAESIPVLTAAADDYMTAIEDEFLAATPPSDNAVSNTVSLESLGDVFDL